MPFDVSLPEILEAHKDTTLENLHTAMPGRVTAYHAGTQTVDVLPLVRRALFDEGGNVVHEDLPVVQNVPVAFPRGGGMLLVFPLAAGDPCWLVFSEASTGAWQTSGDVSDPQDLRRFGLGYPVAIPGGAPDPLALTDAGTGKLVLGVDGNAAQVRIAPGVIQLGASAVESVALATKIDLFIQTFMTFMPAGTVADVTGLKAALTAAGFSPGTTTAATKVKAQ